MAKIQDLRRCGKFSRFPQVTFPLFGHKLSLKCVLLNLWWCALSSRLFSSRLIKQEQPLSSSRLSLAAKSLCHTGSETAFCKASSSTSSNVTILSCAIDSICIFEVPMCLLDHDVFQNAILADFSIDFHVFFDENQRSLATCSDSSPNHYGLWGLALIDDF